ncbi:MAG: metal ABC transporter substrate-binding protein, partial [Rhodothermales bacterium]
LLGCRGEEESSARFVATLPPLAAVVSPVAGEPVAVLVPGGASPHTYEPRPSDARKAARADVLFYGSETLDGWAATLESPSHVALVDLLPDSLRLPAFHGHGVDPHFWMDPIAVKSVAGELADVLCSVEPERCSTYRSNARAFAQELDVVHDSLRIMMDPVAGARVVLAHPFLHYFAERYDLRVVGIVEELSGSEPTPRGLHRMIDAARDARARAVFSQPQHDSRPAAAVAEAVGIPHVELDPMASGEGLPNLLYLNARRISNALADSDASH